MSDFDQTAGPVLVAVDGSAVSEVAVAVAAGIAVSRSAALDIVHVVESSIVPHRHGPDPLPAAVAAAAAAAPGLVVRPLARTGSVTSVLADLSRDYALLVMGRGEHSALADAVRGRTGRSLGSVSEALLHAAHCPLIVVPEDRS